ncbi:3-ketoacyl-CoA synthase 6-like [Ipomoea triloba]|uniref:3-ketoacyl-CoA synthase 6-like n=1 Tax=Ipomoea triloba TaxID=35885 RepID=UPI00125E5E77|nr:3-ketoacyl-CoA synthase 6-like [Ipomoea triloba]
MVPPAKSKLRYVVKIMYHCVVSYIIVFILVPKLLPILIHLRPSDLLKPCGTAFTPIQLLFPATFLLLMIYVASLYLMCRRRTIYLVDYACFKPPSMCRVPFSRALEHGHLLMPTQPKSIRFQMKILERSGLGEETCLPIPLHCLPPNPTMKLAREEAELVIFSAMDQLLAKTQLNPKDIDILVVNCSLFSPTPSLSAMVVNKYRLRSNVKSFNLSGMGCSAGLISIDLARDLLQTYPNSNAVIVSTEILTPNSYMGKERSMLLPNCLFRMGGAAILLSNRRSDRRRAKYRLLHVVRTHMGNKDDSYKCVFQQEDPEGFVGINLCINLMQVAGEALKSNITTIGPLVLPASEQILFVLAFLARKLSKSKSFIKPYVPNFKRAFEHFCIHAGGRAVIDELQKNLDLSDEHVEASRMTLHRFGNTSSSSLWYEMSYIEAKGRMKRGDRVWQIAFGSGFKCNSAVWKCNRSIKAPVPDSPWADCIDQYPVHIPELQKL